MNKMILSQSKTKTWEQTICKRKAIAEMTKEVIIPPTEPMMRGSYFESLALGSGVNGQVTDDLPRLASGKKSIEQIRIDDQVSRFHSLFSPESEEYLGWQITDKQLYLSEGEREGTIDFRCRRDGIRSIWDLKLTGDMMSPGGWWYDIGSMDHVQLAFYKHLHRLKYNEDCETYYALFDYSPKKNIKILKINISEATIMNSLERFDVVEKTLLEMVEFSTTPSYSECGKCRVDCKERVFKPIVTFEEYEC
jgi:hypothetical protein